MLHNDYSISYILLDEFQSFPAGNVIRGHDQSSDRVLQNRLDTRVCGTVVQQQSSSHHTNDERKDLGANKLKVTQLQLFWRKSKII